MPTGYKLPFHPIPSLCECEQSDCHEITWNGKKYANGHNQRGKHKSEQQKQKIKCALKLYFKDHPEAIKRGKDSPVYGRICSEQEKLDKSIRAKEWYKTHDHPCGMKGKHHTDEFKKCRSEKYMGSGNPFFKKHHTQESKDVISLKNIGRKHTEEELNKQSEAQRGQIPWNKGLHIYSEEQKQKWSEERKGSNNPNFGNHLSEEAKANIGRINKIKNKGKTLGHPLYCSHRSDLWYDSSHNGRICFRSSWELELAKYFDSIEEVWKYESKQFHLGNSTYTPDFYLPDLNLYLEVKGWWRRGYKEKFNKFKELYPNVNIIILEYHPPYEFPNLFKHINKEGDLDNYKIRKYKIEGR